MKDNREIQKEALETLVEFNERLLKNMKILVKELSGARLDDTDQFLKGITDAMNWEIQVMNRTMELLNDGMERINKTVFNNKILQMNAAVAEQDDAKTAEAIKELIPEFENLQAAAASVLE